MEFSPRNWRTSEETDHHLKVQHHTHHLLKGCAIELLPKHLRLFTPLEVAEMLQKSVITLKRWRWQGYGPRFVKIGHSVRYKEQDLLEYIEQYTCRNSVRDFMETNGGIEETR